MSQSCLEIYSASAFSKFVWITSLKKKKGGKFPDGIQSLSDKKTGTWFSDFSSGPINAAHPPLENSYKTS